ncbi:hypothetical protein H0A36_20690 [Endozoicomonas sp. SM1973]|uniref:Uncharacterized protein n=1 Tax=Spartinivicinus marinus TaxID=2994442 RepID=A0A853ID10_9GAMM|nr:hypothetical protein [Spartinivicinus marinus]MCX4027338.1 hypothetical protein [Spartinivicinus marinus]NYZ68438.1 hypothetical protein [Spartinivicinus marinus]
MSNSDIAAVASISDSIETSNFQSDSQITSLGAVIYHQSNNKDLISDDSDSQSLFGNIEYGLTITAKSDGDTARIDEFFQSTPTVDLSTKNDDFDYLTENEYNNLSGAGGSDYLLGGAGNDTLLGNGSYGQKDSSLIGPPLSKREFTADQIDDLVQALAGFEQEEFVESGLTDYCGATSESFATVCLPQ